MHLTHYIELRIKQLEQFRKYWQEFNRIMPEAYPMTNKEGVQGWEEDFARFCAQQSMPTKLYAESQTCYVVCIPADGERFEYFTVENADGDERLAVFEDIAQAHAAMSGLNVSIKKVGGSPAYVRPVVRANNILMDEQSMTIATEDCEEWVLYGS